MNTSRCNYCGSEIPAGARFCPGCARPVEQPQYQQASPVQPQGIPPQMPYQQAAQPPHMPYQQGPAGYYAPNVAPLPRKKSKGGIIALIVILALALLGVGSWAVYKYVIKPSLDKNSDVTSFSLSDDDEDDIESFSTDDGDDDDNSFFGGKKEEAENSGEDIPQGLDNKNRYNEPFGMTDEEAAQLRRGNRDVPQDVPKKNATVKNKKKNDKFKGWTKEEKARWRKMKQNNEPFGMTDEEAAEMRRNSRR